MAEDLGPVQEARTRARRRLIGAVVLLAAGIVGFPLLFETKPRPMPVDVPIELVRKDTPAASKPARVLPNPVVELPADAGNESSAGPAPTGVTTQAPRLPTPTAAESVATPAVEPPPIVLPAKPSAPVAKPPPQPLPSPPTPAAVKPSPPASDVRPAEAAASADRSADPKAGRFVVQVGAYTDLGALREARQKVEKLGLKTYTQEVDTPSGKRTRLRVGPFPTRDQAEAAGTRLKAIGLPGNLLSL